MSWYRIQDEDRDTAALLDPANWVSETWNETQRHCRDCVGTGGLDGECGTCDGKGLYAEQPRHGVSVFGTLSRLFEYAEDAAMDLRDTVVVELDGDVSDDDDFDAHAGALLVLPSAIVSATPIAEFAEVAEQLAWDEANR